MGALGRELAAGHLQSRPHLHGDHGVVRVRDTVVGKSSARNLKFVQFLGQRFDRARHERAHGGVAELTAALLGDRHAWQFLDVGPSLAVRTPRQLANARVPPVLHGRMPGPVRRGSRVGEQTDDGARSGFRHVYLPRGRPPIPVHHQLHGPGDFMIIGNLLGHLSTVPRGIRTPHNHRSAVPVRDHP